MWEFGCNVYRGNNVRLGQIKEVKGQAKGQIKEKLVLCKNDLNKFN